jgi:hypothetical protein
VRFCGYALLLHMGRLFHRSLRIVALRLGSRVEHDCSSGCTKWLINIYSRREDGISRDVEPRVCRDLGPATHALRERPDSNAQSAFITHAETATGPCNNDTRAALADDTLRSARSHTISARIPRTSISLWLLTFRQTPFKEESFKVFHLGRRI